MVHRYGKEKTETIWNRGVKMVLTIKYGYGKGTMEINVENFMDMRQISRCRKLIKIIRQSNTPEEIDKLETYINEAIDFIELRLKETAERGVAEKTKAKEAEEKLKKLIEERDRHRKGTVVYKNANKAVKDMRERYKMHNSIYKEMIREFNRQTKNKEFYPRVLEEIHKGR